MDTEQKPDELKQSLAVLPVLVSPDLVKMQITVALSKRKLSVEDLQKRALELVKNEDHLTKMAALLKDLQDFDDATKEEHKAIKQPYWDAGKVADQGRDLLLEFTETIRVTFEADYDKLLADVDQRTRAAAKKKAEEEAILKGIEAHLIDFSNRVVAAISLKQLSGVESLINLEKSPSRSKKYGDFHQQAIVRYDSVLLPVIKDQKEKIKKLETLNSRLVEAEKTADAAQFEELRETIDGISNEILKNNALVQDAVLNQESFAVVEAIEVIPAFKVKRTDLSFEIADVEVALKKSRPLLSIEINNKAAKVVAQQLKKDGDFDDKDEVILNGIKYIATKTRMAL